MCAGVPLFMETVIDTKEIHLRMVGFISHSWLSAVRVQEAEHMMSRQCRIADRGSFCSGHLTYRIKDLGFGV